jgi:hypothetical protein
MWNPHEINEALSLMRQSVDMLQKILILLMPREPLSDPPPAEPPPAETMAQLTRTRR